MAKFGILTAFLGFSSLVAATPAMAATTIDFEGQPTGYQSNPFAIGDATFSTSGFGLFVQDYGSGTGNSLCPTQTGAGCDATLDVGWGSPVDGFTFSYFGLGDPAASIFVTLEYFGGGSSGFEFTPLSEGGIVDLSGALQISAATISTTDPAGLAYDNFTFNIGSPAVPEPSTWAMLILGFFGIGGMVRSQRRRQKVTVSYA